MYDSVFCTGAFGHLLSSADHGVHWDGDDSIQFDTKYGFANCQTISYTNDGLIGAFWVFNALGSHHVLARRERQAAEVEQSRLADPEIKIFPNPATTETTIISNIPGANISIFDMLGKKIKMVTAGADGKAMIDTHDLQTGTYPISINGQRSTILIINN
ncbi:MAG TPA: T9SS type A sorting domain-containing protein [Candidatus Kapabacteria bacterium]|nr:T9SS type A sorting domain-containing protein [Candidatus Kapabacteria bacterium]